MTPWVLLFWLVLATNGSKIDEGPELAADQILEEAVLEAKFFDYRERLGINDRRTLEVFFQLFDLWIMLYRLNKADEALKEVFPACEWRQDDLTIQAIQAASPPPKKRRTGDVRFKLPVLAQALAFTRWKQGRFKARP